MTTTPASAPLSAAVRAAHLLAWLALGVAIALFLRAAWGDAAVRAHDLLAVRNASAVWLHGEDPYDPAACSRGWKAAPPPAYVPESVQTFQTIVPPSAIVLVAPLAMFAPAVAAPVGTCLNIAGIIASALCLWKLLGLDTRSPAAIWVLALAIGLPGCRETILAGQTSGLVLLLFLLHLIMLRRNKVIPAGLLLGLALALKPHLLLCALVVHLAFRYWQALLIASLVVVVLNAGMLLRLAVSPAEPLRHWQQQITQSTQSGAINDWANSARPRYGFINLQLPVYLATGSPGLANGTAILAAAGILALALWRSRPLGQAPCLGLWAVAIGASLLPVYHRGYDGVMLLLPLAWASTQITSGRWLIPALAGILPATLSALRSMRFAPIDPTNYAARVLWGPITAWSVLLCTVGCLILLWRRHVPEAALGDPIPHHD